MDKKIHQNNIEPMPSFKFFVNRSEAWRGINFLEVNTVGELQGKTLHVSMTRIAL